MKERFGQPNQEVRGNSDAGQMRSMIQRSTPAISTLLTSTLLTSTLALIIHVFNPASSEFFFFFGGILY
jgi:hypothetical protein